MTSIDKHMRLIITDDPVSDVKMALAKEHHDRTCKLGELLNAGHVKALEDNDAVRVRLQIEDEIFVEDRQRFPSTELMARLHLAIHAGRSERNRVRIENYDAGDALAYAAMGRVYRAAASPKEFHTAAWAKMLEQGYANVSKITAAVKLPAQKALRRGLRP